MLMSFQWNGCMLMSFQWNGWMDGWMDGTVDRSNKETVNVGVDHGWRQCVAILVIPLRFYIPVYGVCGYSVPHLSSRVCALGTRFNRRSQAGLKNIAVTKCH